MLSGRMSDRLRVARTVANGTIDDDASSVRFPASVGALEASGGDIPREALSRTLVVAARAITQDFPRLAAGSRIEDRRGVAYELVEDMTELRHGRRLVAYEATGLSIEELYPLSADITDQAGAVVTAAVTVALASASERNEGTGTYEDFRGETPLDHHAALNERNRSLTVGSGRYRVVSCVRRPSHVELSLRRAGG